MGKAIVITHTSAVTEASHWGLGHKKGARRAQASPTKVTCMSRTSFLVSLSLLSGQTCSYPMAEERRCTVYELG